MYGLEQIREMNKEIGKEAEENEYLPVLIRNKNNIKKIRAIPHIGDYNPDGFKLTKTLFVDTSGCGQPNEPALTFREFLTKIKENCFYAIIEAGQFQLYVGEFINSRLRKMEVN